MLHRASAGPALVPTVLIQAIFASSDTKMIAAVRKAMRLVESSFQGCYAGRRFDVP